MSIFDELIKISSSLHGSKLAESEASELIEKLPPGVMPGWLVVIQKQFPLAGVCFSLDEDQDESKIGVEMKWFSSSQMIEEALLVYPGKVVLGLGYLPVAACLVGSGDPYFLKMKSCDLQNPPLVRIPHALAIDEDHFLENEIELVSKSLSYFFSQSKVER